MAAAHESMLHCNNDRTALNKTRVTTRRTKTSKPYNIL